MARKQKKKNKNRNWNKYLKIFAVLALLITIIMVGTASALVLNAVKDMPRFDPQLLRESSATSFVYDINGDLLTKLHGEENRTPVKLQDMPLELQQAVIDIEDNRFNKHFGVDIRAIIRAAWRIATNQAFEGGSTITQQLVKNVFLTPETTLKRKIQEAILAIKVERAYTKDQILEMYLNEIHFGHGTQGVQAASKNYFGKDVWELNLTESTILAGIIKNPGRYSPYNNMEACRARQAVVLDQMVKFGHITAEEAAAAKEQPIELAGRSSLSHPAPYFVDYVISILVDELGDHFGSENNVYDAIYKGGLKIYTTIDPQMQQIAEKTLTENLPEGEVDANGITQPQAALVTMETQTGYIKALVGGRNFENTKFNRAIQAQRQPGSAFKTFVYATAFDNGFTPATIYVDEPVSIPVSGGRIWEPRNYNSNQYEGPTTLRRAVERSLNTIAAQLIMDVGVTAVVDYAERMGITTLVKTGAYNDMQPAIALGGLTHGVTPLDMAVGYGVLANQGVRVEPMAVLRVEDRNGNILLEKSPTQTQVLSPQTSYLMTNVLKGVITAQGGTGGRANIGRPAAGKTGTTSDYNDAWFVGYTPELVTSIWVGSDERTPGEKSYMERNRIGSALPAQIWGAYMKEVVKDIPVSDFTRPSNIVGPIHVCTKSGLLPSEICPPEHIKGEIFIGGTEPQSTCNIHEKVFICRDTGLLATNYCPHREAHVFIRQPDGTLEDAPTEYCQLHTTPELVQVTICSDSGLLATNRCPKPRQIFLLKGREPEGYCTIHGNKTGNKSNNDWSFGQPEQRETEGSPHTFYPGQWRP
ncbi:MAG: transglycosylase domain-containing protein [bacterium]|jgi:penicillin-binding protein 1A